MKIQIQLVLALVLLFTINSFSQCNFQAPYYEDFENGGLIPNCWEQGLDNNEDWIFENDATNTGHVGVQGREYYNNATLSGGYFAYIDDSSPHSTNTSLISPSINLNGLINPALSFYFVSSNEDMDGSGEATGNVSFNIDVFDGNSWHNNYYSSSRDSYLDKWEKVIVNLDSFIDQIIKIRFRVDEVSTYYKDDFAIDDIVVAEKIDCDNVYLGQVPVVLETTVNSIKASWEDQFNLSSLTWKVEIVENGEQPTGVGIDVDKNKYVFANLSENTYYDVYYKFDCDNSNWEMITIRTALLSEMDSPYAVEPIPYKNYYYDYLAGLGINVDDGYSILLNLGYNFNYFGYDYDKITVGSNSVLSFNIDDANGYCPYSFDELIPSENIIDNAILGAYQDYDTSELDNGVVGFSSIGRAPFRKFIIVFNNVPLYACSDITSSNQTLLYETYNFIDVQIKDRNVCSTINNGNAIIGIQSVGGQYAYFPPNRNTGDWEAHNEAWRFRPMQNYPDYQYILCDINVDGVETFDLNTVYAHFDNGAGNNYTTFLSLDNAENNTNALTTTTFTNTTNAQTIFVRELTSAGDISIKQVLLAAIDCSADYDLDDVATSDEDLNNNGNYGDDDTDGDQIPNFLDEDDDGDYVLTSVEAVVTQNRSTSNTTDYLDTDGDQIPNYLDNDDDGDGILSLDEDVNGNYNLLDDDTDGDNIPDYLDNEALSVNNNQLDYFNIYPNPAKDNLIIKLNNEQLSVAINIYTIQGQQVYFKQNINNILEIDISSLSNGMYFVNVSDNEKIYTKKFIKE